jgi:peptidoglycan/xylan/chitin deacetylase (PgdA/CDA1 family)
MTLLDTLAGVASRGRGIILNYHTPSASEMRAHLEVFARSFDFVSHDELVSRLSGSAAGRPFCFLTFDDGKRSNASGVAPVLIEAGVPAAFYLATGFVSQGDRPLWFDRAAALAARVPDLPADLQPDALKLATHEHRDRRLAEACQQYGIDADMTSDDVRPMSWDDARALAARGFTIGAHSQWHAILTREATEYACAEIADSIQRVATELNAACTTFCFPNGNYTERLARHAQACGAATVMTCEPAWAGPGSDTWRLPRIQVFGRQSALYATTKVMAARVPGLLPNPDGTGRRYVLARFGG